MNDNKRFPQDFRGIGRDLADSDIILVAKNEDGEVLLTTVGAIRKAIVAELAQTSPEALNTLEELAAAMANDPNFATTVLNNLATKVSKSGAETIDGPKTFSVSPKVPAAGQNSDAASLGDVINIANTLQGDTRSSIEEVENALLDVIRNILPKKLGTTGNYSLLGEITFDKPVTIPPPTSSDHAVNLYYLRDVLSSITGDTSRTIEYLDSLITSIGEAMPYKADLIDGKIPSDQIPGTIDDTIEVLFSGELITDFPEASSVPDDSLAVNLNSWQLYSSSGGEWMPVDAYKNKFYAFLWEAKNNLYRYTGSSFVNINTTPMYATDDDAKAGVDKARMMNAYLTLVSFLHNISNRAIAGLENKTVVGSITELKTNLEKEINDRTHAQLWERLNQGWYLPTRDEMLALYAALGNTAEKRTQYNLLKSGYWSSSEQDASKAYAISFNEEGAVRSTMKNVYISHSVKPIRHFFSAETIAIGARGELGWVFYTDKPEGPAGRNRYFEAHTAQFPLSAWSSGDYALLGTSTSIGWGLANSSMMMAKPGGDAAWRCREAGDKLVMPSEGYLMSKQAIKDWESILVSEYDRTALSYARTLDRKVIEIRTLSFSDVVEGSMIANKIKFFQQADVPVWISATKMETTVEFLTTSSDHAAEELITRLNPANSTVTITLFFKLTLPRPVITGAYNEFAKRIMGSAYVDRDRRDGSQWDWTNVADKQALFSRCQQLGNGWTPGDVTHVESFWAPRRLHTTMWPATHRRRFELDRKDILNLSFIDNLNHLVSLSSIIDTEADIPLECQIGESQLISVDGDSFENDNIIDILGSVIRVYKLTLYYNGNDLGYSFWLKPAGYDMFTMLNNAPAGAKLIAEVSGSAHNYYQMINKDLVRGEDLRRYIFKKGKPTQSVRLFFTDNNGCASELSEKTIYGLRKQPGCDLALFLK